MANSSDASKVIGRTDFEDIDANLATIVDDDESGSSCVRKTPKLRYLPRNGYLQAQLETSQQTIKHLEDKQKVVWWQRLWRWREFDKPWKATPKVARSPKLSE